MRLLLTFILLLPALGVAETARIVTWNLGGFYQIPQSHLDNILVMGDYNMIPGEDDINFDALKVNRSFLFVSDGLGGTHIGWARQKKIAMHNGLGLTLKNTQQTSQTIYRL